MKSHAKIFPIAILCILTFTLSFFLVTTTVFGQRTKLVELLLKFRNTTNIPSPLSRAPAKKELVDETIEKLLNSPKEKKSKPESDQTDNGSPPQPVDENGFQYVEPFKGAIPDTAEEGLGYGNSQGGTTPNKDKPKGILDKPPADGETSSFKPTEEITENGEATEEEKCKGVADKKGGKAEGIGKWDTKVIKPKGAGSKFTVREPTKDSPNVKKGECGIAKPDDFEPADKKVCCTKISLKAGLICEETTPNIGQSDRVGKFSEKGTPCK